MKNLTYIVLLLIFSCNNYENNEIREPFEINHQLTTDALLNNHYERVWGVDVLLFGKRTNNVNVYYQIDLPERKREIKDENDFLNFIRKNGTISYKNHEEEVTEKEYIKLKKTINSTNYKIINIEHIKDNYLRDRFKVVNLKTQDTFSCSFKYENDNFIFSSNINIKTILTI